MTLYISYFLDLHGHHITELSLTFLYYNIGILKDLFTKFNIFLIAFSERFNDTFFLKISLGDGCLIGACVRIPVDLKTEQTH